MQVHVQLPTNVTAQRGDAYSSGVICKHDNIDLQNDFESSEWLF